MTVSVPLPFGARLIIECDTEAAVAMLHRLATRDRRPLLEKVAALTRESLGEQFAAGGPGWQALAASTVAAKRMAGLPPTGKGGKPLRRLMQGGTSGPGSILIASGTLRDSYRQKGARGHVEHIDAGSDTVEVGSQLPTPDGRYSLAAIHQGGTSPYTIRARNKKALAFTGRSGEGVLRRAVHHPGVAARPVVVTPELVEQETAALVAFYDGEEIR